MTSNEPIIIIDDDLDDQFLMKKICEELNICNNIIFFDDGREALQYLRTTTQKPFIIICDINMPAMNGLELRREINKDEYLRRKSIPFVFFSTATSPAQIREAYDLSVQGFFLKETTFAKVKQTLKMILEYWANSRHPNAAE